MVGADQEGMTFEQKTVMLIERVVSQSEYRTSIAELLSQRERASFLVGQGQDEDRVQVFHRFRGPALNLVPSSKILSQLRKGAAKKASVDHLLGLIANQQLEIHTLTASMCTLNLLWNQRSTPTGTRAVEKLALVKNLTIKHVGPQPMFVFDLRVMMPTLKSIDLRIDSLHVGQVKQYSHLASEDKPNILKTLPVSTTSFSVYVPGSIATNTVKPAIVQYIGDNAHLQQIGFHAPHSQAWVDYHAMMRHQGIVKNQVLELQLGMDIGYFDLSSIDTTFPSLKRLRLCGPRCVVEIHANVELPATLTEIEFKTSAETFDLVLFDVFDEDHAHLSNLKVISLDANTSLTAVAMPTWRHLFQCPSLQTMVVKGDGFLEIDGRVDDTCVTRLSASIEHLHLETRGGINFTALLRLLQEPGCTWGTSLKTIGLFGREPAETHKVACAVAKQCSQLKSLTLIFLQVDVMDACKELFSIDPLPRYSVRLIFELSEQ